MASDLRSRLKRLKEYRSNHPPHHEQRLGDEPTRMDLISSASTTDKPISNALDGWNSTAPLIFTRYAKIDLPGPVGAEFDSRLLGRRVAFHDLCFMDTETTGLSGGAGTLVFLVGSAHYSNGEVTVQQTLLGDFPGEPAFLQVVHEQLLQSGIWVNYNGKSFDSRLIETRFLMNGQEVSIPEQLDLLYWARRLWRRIIGPCSLGDIEREILGVSRVGDIAGIEIPERYFGFLKTGDPIGLEPVFAHHLEDIVSVVRLFLHLENVLESVQRAGGHPESFRFDRFGLGKYLALRGTEGGEALLRGVVTGPRPEETLYERERAAYALSQVLRKTGRGAETSQLWERLWREGSLSAGVEFAKHLEHRTGRVREAANIVEVLLPRANDQHIHDQLAHRLSRLRRKLTS